MKKRIIAGLLCLTTLAFGETVNLEVRMSGEVVGEATFTIIRNPKGGMEQRMSMKISVQGATYDARETSIYDAKFRPIKVHNETISNGSKTVYDLVYQKDGVHDTTVVDGKKTVKVVKYPAKKTIARPSQGWFFSHMPMVGEVSQEISYNKGKWEERVSRYMGTQKITVNGKQVKAYETIERRKDGTGQVHQWVDLKGFPYRMEVEVPNSTLHLERKP